MPIYLFECTCGNTFEELVLRGTEKSICPKCKRDARKILSRSNFILKGGGWGNTGYQKVPDPSGVYQTKDGCAVCTPIHGNTPKYQ